MTGLLTLLFPPRCAFCRRKGADGLCADCQSTLPWVRNAPDSEVTAPLYYRGAVRKAVHRFKFGGALGNAAVFGWLMARCVNPDGIDAVTYVPCSFLRRLSRGYDQSYLLAREAAKYLDKPLVKLLKRKRHGTPQYLLKDSGARADNVKGAFSVRTGVKLPPETRLLLADDLYTTGATWRACRDALHSAGFRQIRLICAARK